MGKLGGQRVQELIERHQANEERKGMKNHTIDDIPESDPSKLIIPPASYWNMQWNNLIQVGFVAWILYAPLVICIDTRLSPEALSYLLVFDILFLLDRVADLFVGFKKADGTEETRLTNVLYQNISMKLLIEIVVGYGPFLFDIERLHTMYYFFFKVFRCTRIFEMENHINEVIEYYGEKATRAETQSLRKNMELITFIFTTLIDLHLLTCIQIALCTYRDFGNSWMGSHGIDPESTSGQYIVALYFVSTTLTTCGFGDIYATEGDPVEAGVIFFLQFVGMLFYSMTIQKI
jgi:hypothetical protein